MAVRLQLRRRWKGIGVPSRVSTAPNAFRLTSVVVASGDMNSLCARRPKANSSIEMRSRVQNARVRQLDHTSTLPDHSAGSDSDTALVFTFRLGAASHRQMT